MISSAQLNVIPSTIYTKAAHARPTLDPDDTLQTCTRHLPLGRFPSSGRAGRQNGVGGVQYADRAYAH